MGGKSHPSGLALLHFAKGQVVGGKSHPPPSGGSEAPKGANNTLALFGADGRERVVASNERVVVDHWFVSPTFR